MRILVTGVAGFIGSAVARALIDRGYDVVGVDNFNTYYDVALKRARVASLLPNIPIYRLGVEDEVPLMSLCRAYRFDAVCHLAAQAGVRYSVDMPATYVASNVLGTQAVLEAMRQTQIPHLVYASTSSVYGQEGAASFVETHAADRPVSVYAATKRAGELLAHSYHHQYGISVTNLRFFTVYGPWSRPDMAMWLFTKAILKGEPIQLFNQGMLERDFTYIDDIVAGFTTAVLKPLGYEQINLGNGQAVPLNTYVATLERVLGMTAQRQLVPMQAGDVYRTQADIGKAKALLGYQPRVSLEAGVASFVSWYREYHNV